MEKEEDDMPLIEEVIEGANDENNNEGEDGTVEPKGPGMAPGMMGGELPGSNLNPFTREKIQEMLSR
jgi:hypothetical protein